MKISFCLLSVSFLAQRCHGFIHLRPKICSVDNVTPIKSLPRPTAAADKNDHGLLRSSLAVSLAAMCALLSPVPPATSTINPTTPTRPAVSLLYENNLPRWRPPSALATDILTISSSSPPPPAAAAATTTKSIVSHDMPRYAKIIDLSGRIDPASAQTLQKRISRIESKVGTEIQIIAADQVERGYTPKRMATSLFNAWKIGPSDKNNGVLILAILDERRIEIEVGKGINKYMDQSWCQNMLQTTAVPLFRQERYGPGLVEVVTDVSKRLVKIDADVVVTSREQGLAKNLNQLQVPFLVTYATVFAYFAATFRAIYDPCPQCQADNSCWVPVDERQGWTITKEASYGEKGYKVRPYKCRECGYQQDAVQSFSYGSDSINESGDSSSSSWDDGGGDSGGSSDGGGGGSDW